MKFISEIEKGLLKKTLNHFKGNQIKSSKLLGINRNTFYDQKLKNIN